MTNHMKHKLYKAQWRYQLHDDMGCIREFKTKELAEYWKINRPELMIKVIKPKKITYKDLVESNDNPFDILF